MAEKALIPDYKSKQKILYVDDTPDENLGAIADALLSQKRYSEAFDYLERMEDETKLKAFMADAKTRGDLFNYAKAARILNVEPTAKDWEELASMAIHGGFIVNAVDALRRAGNKARARELIAANPDFFGPTLEMERLAKPGPAVDLDDDEEEEKAEAKHEPAPQLEAAPETPKEEKILDPEEAAREAAARERKKKWKSKKK